MRWIAAIGVLSALAIGCRQHAYLDAHLELLNAERRALEDQLYQLDDELRLCQRENQRLRADTTPPPAERAPRRPRPSPDALEIPELTIPPIEEGVPLIEVPDQGATHRSHPSEPLVTRLGPHDPRITRLAINPRLTGLVGSDSTENDELQIAVEPRNSSGYFIPLAGPMTIVASLDGGPEIGRWNLDAAQTQQALDQGGLQPGFIFRLPWTQPASESGPIQLQVQYQTVDGRQLAARAPLPSHDSPELAQHRVSEEVVASGSRNHGVQAASWQTESAATAGDWLDSLQPLTPPQWRPYR